MSFRLHPRGPARLALVVLTAIAVAAAGRTARPADLTVSAASSLTQVMRDLGKQFEAANPDTTVRFNFAASGALLAQISQGAPVDVLATADQETMNQAQGRGLLHAQSRRDFATNALVVIVPMATMAPPAALQDLTAARFDRIAIGLPASVPAGRYTQAALQAANLWQQITPRMIGTSNVRQALDYVARGEVSAGFVYATDARLVADRVKVAFAVPTPTPIRYPVAALNQAPNPTAARRFVDFLSTEPAQARLGQSGFGQP